MSTTKSNCSQNQNFCSVVQSEYILGCNRGKNCEETEYIRVPILGEPGRDGIDGPQGINGQILLTKHLGRSIRTPLVATPFLNPPIENMVFSYIVPVSGCYFIVTSATFQNTSTSDNFITYTIFSPTVPDISMDPNETTRFKFAAPQTINNEVITPGETISLSTNGTYCFQSGDIITVESTGLQTYDLLYATFDATLVAPTLAPSPSPMLMAQQSKLSSKMPNFITMLQQLNLKTEVKAQEVKQVVAPVVKQVVAPEVKQVVSPEIKTQVVAPVVTQVVAPVVKQVVAPVVKQVVSPEVKQVVAPVVKQVAPEIKQVAPEIKAQVVAPVVKTQVVAPVVKQVSPEVKTQVVAPEIKAQIAPVSVTKPL
jgi:hypothetical protein